jgi:phosphatidylinositol glycan class Q protein
MLPVKRITVGELWKLLTEDQTTEDVAPANGHVFLHGQLSGKKGHNKTKGMNGYWWSK